MPLARDNRTGQIVDVPEGTLQAWPSSYSAISNADAADYKANQKAAASKPDSAQSAPKKETK